jgi:hypothetical protein
MMNERIEPKKIRVYAVVPYEQWTEVANDEDERRNFHNFDYWQEYDYAVTAIMVEESLVFLDDNMHNNPSAVLEGIVVGLKEFFPVDTFEDVLLLGQDIYEYNKTKVQEAIYNKWRSGN